MKRIPYANMVLRGGGTYPTLCIREPTPMLDYRAWYMRFPEGGTLSTGDPPPQDGAEV